MPSSYTLGDHFEGFVRETLRTAKLAALRAEIEEGLASGPAQPPDMAEIKAEARRTRAARHQSELKKLFPVIPAASKNA